MFEEQISRSGTYSFAILKFAINMGTSKHMTLLNINMLLSHNTLLHFFITSFINKNGSMVNN